MGSLWALAVPPLTPQQGPACVPPATTPSLTRTTATCTVPGPPAPGHLVHSRRSMNASRTCTCPWSPALEEKPCLCLETQP